jgi:hypothetical protein
MRTFRQSVVALALVLAVGLCPGGSQSPRKARQAARAAKAAAAKAAKSLIRRDLLSLKKPEAAPPKRNIFAPRVGPNFPAEPAGAGQPVATPDFSAGDASAKTKETASAPPAITVNLRYIGFIVSPRRLVALVIFEGQAIAVVEGDVVGEGIRIGKVGRDEVEVVLPDSSTRTFSLEGE